MKTPATGSFYLFIEDEGRYRRAPVNREAAEQQAQRIANDTGKPVDLLVEEYRHLDTFEPSDG